MEDITLYITVFDTPVLNTVLLFLTATAILSIIRWILDLLP